jgi:nitroreductase
VSPDRASRGTFLEVVGSRRSIRWFRPWQPVERRAIQRVLETARSISSPGNLQPWRAVVVEAAELDEASRARLLEANNWQGPHVLAPVWIYWYADPSAAAPAAFLEGVRALLPTGALPTAFGWSEEHARAAIQDGVAPPPGMPGLDRFFHQLPPEVSALIAAQETNAAITVATLAAVNEGLGSCLQSIAVPAEHAQVREILGVPHHFVPVWLLLLGHPAESPDAGGQRPRVPFEELFAWRRWGTPFRRDPEVVEELRHEALLQPEAPLAGRTEELERLGRMFADLLERERPAR